MRSRAPLSRIDQGKSPRFTEQILTHMYTIRRENSDTETVTTDRGQNGEWKYGKILYLIASVDFFTDV